jgi:FkbM family methyltransferase
MADNDKLGFVDVGARGGMSSHLDKFADVLMPVLCEPEAVEYKRLVELSDGGSLYKVIGKPLAHIDGQLTLHETVNPFCSSILKANTSYLAQYDIAKHFALDRSVSVECARYDSLYRSQELPLPSIIKIDVQGFEYQVLQGFGGLLNHCLALQVEAHFYPLYEGQKLLHDLVDLVSGYGLVLRRLFNGRSPALNGDRHFDGDLVEVDAVFTKSRQWAQSQPVETRNRLNLACEIIGVQANR